MPTGIPLVYELDESMHAQKRYYLGDKRKVEAGLNEVASQTKLPEKEKDDLVKEK
jgi:2,3-bisphosphoglycerate-dependent phosphoglycerate mutase